MDFGKIWLFVVSVDGLPYAVFTSKSNAVACIADLRIKMYDNIRLTELQMRLYLSFFKDE